MKCRAISASSMDNVVADVVIVLLIMMAIAVFVWYMHSIRYGDTHTYVNIFKYIELKVEDFNNASRLAT